MLRRWWKEEKEEDRRREWIINNNIIVLIKLFINKKLIAYIKEQEICKIKGSKRNYSTKLSHNELMNLLNDDMKKMKI